MMLGVLSCAHGFLCIFFRGKSIQVLRPFLNRVVYLYMVELYVSFTYSGYEALIRYLICKSFLPFCRVSSHYPDSVFWCTKVVNSVEAYCVLNTLWLGTIIYKQSASFTLLSTFLPPRPPIWWQCYCFYILTAWRVYIVLATTLSCLRAAVTMSRAQQSSFQ